MWAKKIQMEKFRWHNSQWLEMVESPSSKIDDDDIVGYPDDVLGNYIGDADVLDQSDFLYGSNGIDQ